MQAHSDLWQEREDGTAGVGGHVGPSKVLLLIERLSHSSHIYGLFLCPFLFNACSCLLSFSRSVVCPILFLKLVVGAKVFLLLLLKLEIDT